MTSTAQFITDHKMTRLKASVKRYTNYNYINITLKVTNKDEIKLHTDLGLLFLENRPKTLTKNDV